MVKPNQLMVKAGRVLDSCKTAEQWVVAKRYVALVNRKIADTDYFYIVGPCPFSKPPAGL